MSGANSGANFSLPGLRVFERGKARPYQQPVTPADRSKIEAALAQRVQPTTATEDAAQQRQADEGVQRVGRASR